MIRPQFSLRTALISLTCLAGSFALIRVGFASSDNVGGLLCLLGIAIFGTGIGVLFGSARLGAGLALLLTVVLVILTSFFAIQS